MYDKRLIASIFILATQKSHFRSRFQNQKVRQSFTNAIIHSDLLMDAGILRVEKHNDRYRLCFRNPGLLRLPIEQIFEGGVSYARNPKIQNMLRMVGYGENLGSGFPLILDAWKQAGWNTPVLNNRFELDMVELVLPLSAVPEKVPNSKDEITPSAENDDGEDPVRSGSFKPGLYCVAGSVLRTLIDNLMWSPKRYSVWCCTALG